MNKINISVAMATYNGDRYIEKQLDSILFQLKEKDELIISDDGSKDETLKIIKKFQLTDKRIKLLNGPQKGFVKNFENSINYCRNDIIFLSDQDDVWVDKKVQTILKAFENDKSVSLIAHNAEIINELGEKTEKNMFEIRSPKRGYVHNILRSHYFGCCMAFRKSLLTDVLPFPEKIPAHDQWISNVAEKTNKTKFIEDVLILYRRHDQNVSRKLSLFYKIKFRIDMIQSLYGYRKEL